MDNETEKKNFAAGEESSYSPHTSPNAITLSGTPAPPQGHQRLVFTDPAAFRYLEEDPSVTVLERRRRLEGYELYIVEQWACSRMHPTFVITTYTGDKNSVVVGILSVPTDETRWSQRLRVYLQAVTKYHARKKETDLGTLMVTNLSSFPSALTVIAVPDGDLKKHREDFIVNEDMKRLGCSGRAGLNLSLPTSATELKFRQLYRTFERIPLYNAVIELVKLCQVALMLFGKLAPEYADGLLCDITEQAINDWWTEIGADYFTIDPSDGILGPTTVAALLGMLMGARNRLNAYGAPVAKDVFDVVTTKRAIAHFQKSQKLERTRRLDPKTLRQLHNVTAKAASGEGWAVPRAVKSTVAELSGKGGDLLNGREKSRIAEVETLDIETFIELGSGGRFKWLWLGKPRKHADSDMFANLADDDGMIFKDNEHGWTKRGSIDEETSLRHVLSDKIYQGSINGSQTSIDHLQKDQALHKAVFKNVTGKVTDARSGLGRIRDAVGRKGHRGHHHRFPKEENAMSDGDSVKDRPRTTEEKQTEPDIPIYQPSPPDSNEQSLTNSELPSRRGSDYPEVARRPNNVFSPPLYNSVNDEYNKSNSSLENPEDATEPRFVADHIKYLDKAAGITGRSEGREPFDASRHTSLTAADAQAIQNMQKFQGQYTIPPLRTTRSLSGLPAKRPDFWDRRWPRHLSWTAMVDVVAASVPRGMSDADSIATRTNADFALAFEKSLAVEASVMGQRLETLKTRETAWVEQKVSQVEAFDRQADKDQSTANMVYHQKNDEFNSLHNACDDLLSEERTNLAEAIKDIETLGNKLEYELTVLQSKVEDVENGVAEFERQVAQIEARAEELDGEGETKVTWLGWFFGKLLV